MPTPKCGAAVALVSCLSAAPAWAGEKHYETREDANLPFCLAPSHYKDGLAAAKHHDPDIFAKTGCVVPEGGLLVKVLGEAPGNLHRMQVIAPSGKTYIVYAPLKALVRKDVSAGP